MWVLTVVACALCHREETAYLTVQTTAAELEAALETLPNIDDVDVFRSAATGPAGYNGCAGCWQLQKQVLTAHPVAPDAFNLVDVLEANRFRLSRGGGGSLLTYVSTPPPVACTLHLPCSSFFWTITFEGANVGGNVPQLVLDSHQVIANSVRAQVTTPTQGSEVGIT